MVIMDTFILLFSALLDEVFLMLAVPFPSYHFHPSILVSALPEEAFLALVVPSPPYH
jgi:hypothetical protein